MGYLALSDWIRGLHHRREFVSGAVNMVKKSTGGESLDRGCVIRLASKCLCWYL